MSATHGVVIGVGVGVVGVVGGIVAYKVIKKKNPNAFGKAKDSFAGMKDKASGLMSGSRKAFREGYDSAKAAEATA